MDIISIFKKFPDKESCIVHLEKVLWGKVPVCPYCNSFNYSNMKEEYRYHCNTCNTSYSVTVGTIFHNTKLPIQKWFLAISLVLDLEKITARQLAKEAQVTKDTAWRMLTEIRNAMYQYGNLFQSIIEFGKHY